MKVVERRVFVVDLDRTLIDLEKVMQVFYESCEQLSIDKNIVTQAQAEIESRGQSFHALDYLKSQSLIDGVENFRNVFLKNSKTEDLLYPDAREFINKIITNDEPVMILTYGETEWQMLKLQAAGLLQVPAVITDNKEKGTWFTKRLMKNGLYNIEHIGEAENISFIDDKLISFNNLPTNIKGYWINRNSESDKVPNNIQKIASLREIKL